MKSWYFTFGCGHPLRDYVQKVNATSEASARKTMCDFYGTFWAFCYGPFDDAYKDNTKWSDERGRCVYTLTPHSLTEGECL